MRQAVESKVKVDQRVVIATGVKLIQSWMHYFATGEQVTEAVIAGVKNFPD